MDVLILRAVSWGPIHGYGVARWIEGATGEALKVEEGTLIRRSIASRSAD